MYIAGLKMASQVPITVRTQPTAVSTAALRGKKRPGSPAVSVAQQATASGGTVSGKKKKGQPAATPTTLTQTTGGETVAEVKATASADSGPAATTTESTAKPPPFKDHTFMHSGIGGAAAGKKNRTWKNLKQILALERTLPWKLNDPNYYNIDAPPSLKPAKKYSDISGLPANYTDPQTKLRFTSTEEFSYIRLLPTDVVTGYLALRKATCIVP
ncbi:INO80 complex subunit C [Parambassis ranga]|uniref:INO80 complex subunit C n=1 Tax=Parambassis ranga TaxID=210632 RepID=A0A6P7JYI0_9TELE|nr:INO80 complex subunit C [Parambassis ranga]